MRSWASGVLDSVGRAEVVANWSGDEDVMGLMLSMVPPGLHKPWGRGEKKDLEHLHE
jgi:hypothetical protein